MKKNCAIATALIFWALCGHAQAPTPAPGAPTTETTGGGMKWGLEAGYNINSFSRSNNNNNNIFEGNHSHSGLSGWHAGVIAEFNSGNHFAIQPALRYIQKGGELGNVFNFVNLNRTVYTTVRPRLSYIELPVDFVYKFGCPGTGARFMVGVGPYLGYMVGASSELNRRVTTLDGIYVSHLNTDRHDVDLGNGNGNRALNRWDFGGQAFIGVEGSMGWFAKVGGSLGFTNLHDDNNVDFVNANVTNVGNITLNNIFPRETDGFFHTHNYNFFVTVGYLFGGKCASK
jgi:hypothetical protein